MQKLQQYKIKYTIRMMTIVVWIMTIVSSDKPREYVETM